MIRVHETLLFVFNLRAARKFGTRKKKRGIRLRGVSLWVCVSFFLNTLEENSGIGHLFERG